MRYLLDSTVLVDIERGHRPTIGWLARQPPDLLYVSAVTIGELVRGVHKRHRPNPAGLPGELAKLDADLSASFPGRVLAFDREAAAIGGRLIDQGEARGRRPPVDDAKTAAIALRHDMTVATSNTADFVDMVAVLDPRTA